MINTRSFLRTRFLLSAMVKPDSLSPLAEVAIFGRSNVGKSSLINHLTKRRKLAKISGKPGKTQTLNFYSVDDSFHLVDLPGFGYAKVSYKERSDWGKAVETYLKSSVELKAVICLFDFKRALSTEDLSLLSWLKLNHYSLLILFTKKDKLHIREHSKQLNIHKEQLSTVFENEMPPLLTYSNQSEKSRLELIHLIAKLV